MFVRTDPACGSVLKWLDRSTPIAARQLVPKRTGWRAFFVVGSAFASWHTPKQHQSRTRALVPTGTLFGEPPGRVTSAGWRGEVAMTPIDANANQGTPQQGQSTAAPNGPMKRGPKRAGDSAKRGKWLRHSSSRSPLASGGDHAARSLGKTRTICRENRTYPQDRYRLTRYRGLESPSPGDP